MPVRDDSELGRTYADLLRDHQMRHEEVEAVARRVVQGRFRFRPHDVEEVVARTIYELLTYVARGKPVTSLSGLVSTMAFREARKSLPPRNVEFVPAEGEGAPADIAADFDLSDEIERRLFQIAEFFRHHNPECLKQMMWRTAGYATNEIASALGMKPNTADVRWMRCREAVIEALGRDPGWQAWFRKAL